ncbi:MAG: IclR family transcriptional regulator [Comamonas sp.]
MTKNTTSADEAPEGVGVAAVNRALSILEAFSKERRSLSLTQLAEQTGLYKSTVLRLAESLEAAGYLYRDSQGIYNLGPTPLRLAALYRSSLHPSEFIMPILRELSGLTGESAALYTRAGNKRLCAYRVSSSRAISDNVQQDELLSLDKGAGGHVLQAFSGAEGERYEEIRRTFSCLTMGERDQETAAIACPVFGPQQKLEGALSISGPLHRFTPDAVSAMHAHLMAAGVKITMHFGGDTTVYPSFN